MPTIEAVLRERSEPVIRALIVAADIGIPSRKMPEVCVEILLRSFVSADPYCIMYPLSFHSHRKTQVDAVKYLLKKYNCKFLSNLRGKYVLLELDEDGNPIAMSPLLEKEFDGYPVKYDRRKALRTVLTAEYDRRKSSHVPSYKPSKTND